MATIDVKDAANVTQTLERPLPPGQAAMAASRPVVIANNQSAVPVSVSSLPALPAGTNNIGDVDIVTMPAVAVSTVGGQTPAYGSGATGTTVQRVTIATDQLGALIAGGVPVVSGGYEYEPVAAGQTDQIMGATGAVGDYLESLLCVVTTAATSEVKIKDGNGTAMTVFPNNVGAGVGTYPIPIGLTCVNATTPGWKITTGAGVSVLVTGNFT